MPEWGDYIQSTPTRLYANLDGPSGITKEKDTRMSKACSANSGVQRAYLGVETSVLHF